MIRKPRGIGGNAVFSRLHMDRNNGRTLVVRRTAAIGDSLAATVVADRLIDLGHYVIWQTHPAVHAVIRRHPFIQRVEAPSGKCDINLDDAYEKDPNRSAKSFWDIFVNKANQQIAGYAIALSRFNCRPRLDLSINSQRTVTDVMEKHPRPWVIICPRSNFYRVRQVQDGVWSQIVSGIKGTCFWLGNHGPAPKGVVNLKAQHLDHVMEWIGAADLMISVDTGPMHIAAAVGTPLVIIGQSNDPTLRLNNQNDFTVVSPDLSCLNCQKNICPVNEWTPPCNNIPPQLVIEAANQRLDGDGRVSTVIPTWKPPADRLNKCISAVVEQVYEVIVSVDIGGIIPPGVIQHAKVRYVHRPANIGRNSFSANCNFGARHTSGEFVHFLNDDCYLEAGAIQACMDEMSDDRVGLVGHLLRYGPRSPRTGKINHGGKFRNPGAPCFGLFDWGQWHPTVKIPMDVECVTGTSILVRRSALYDINGWNEEYIFYGEDDDFSMEMRRHGWKIRYTPHAMAIHDEAQTTYHTGKLNEWMHHGHNLLAQRWGEYFRWNKSRIPGDFSYLNEKGKT